MSRSLGIEANKYQKRFKKSCNVGMEAYELQKSVKKSVAQERLMLKLMNTKVQKYKYLERVQESYEYFQRVLKSFVAQEDVRKGLYIVAKTILIET